MILRFRYLSLAIGILILSCPRTSVAQVVSVEVAPLIGIAASGTDLFEWEGAYSALPFVSNGVQVTGKHTPALAVGARVTLWATESFGIETSLAYSQSNVETVQTILAGDILPPSSNSFNTPAQIWLGAIKGLFRLPAGDRIKLLLGGGVGVVSRGGEAYEEGLYTTPTMGMGPLEPSTTIGGHLDLGASAALTPSLALRFDLENFIHSTDSSPGSSYAQSQSAALRGQGTSPLQWDLMVSTSVVVRF